MIAIDRLRRLFGGGVHAVVSGALVGGDEMRALLDLVDAVRTRRDAALLARRLLELGVSAIVDIYELGAQRQRFVKLFLEALVNAPRDLWHPALIVIDEAHLHCPEAGHAESAGAVIDLMTRGRKRGFCGVLATQRIAKLHKDAAAEANNKLIGRSSLDIDMKRAAAELGFTTREDMQRLRKLPAGEFFAFGPALAEDVTLVKVGPVSTTHPKAGQRAAPPTPPRAKIREVLAQLADLPAEAAAEAQTAADLRVQVAELKRQLAARPAAEVRVIEKRILGDAEIARLEKAIAPVQAALERFDVATETLGGLLADMAAAVQLAHQLPPAPGASEVQLARRATPAHVVERRVYPSGQAAKVRELVPGSIPIGEAATLRALIQYPAGLRREQLTVLTGYKRSTRDAYIARLRDKGFLETTGDVARATREGASAMPGAKPLPTGAALRAWWLDRLPSGERAVLDVLVASYPASEQRSVIDIATGFKRSTRDAYLSRLAARQLVEDVRRGEVRASATLFEETP